MTPTWAPYVAWMKDAPPARFDLRGSNLTPCDVEDLPGAREALELHGEHEEGYEPYVAAIARHSRVSPDRVAVANGASGANFLVYAALLRAGDEVVVEEPVYDPLLGMARLLGARLRRFRRVFEEGFRVDPDRVAAALTPRTRLVVLTNLHNPTGVLTSEEVLEEVGARAEAVGARVLVDEVYLETAHGRKSSPAATLSETFISTNSLTKAYGLAGIRAGWAVAEPKLAESLRRVRDVVDGNGSFPSELLAYLAFRQLDALRERARGILEPNLDLLRGFVDSRDELEWVPPAGGSVGFPRIRDRDDTSEFVETLRKRHQTGVVPGRFFEAPAHVRIALGGQREALEEGLRRLGRALEEESR